MFNTSRTLKAGAALALSFVLSSGAYADNNQGHFLLDGTPVGAVYDDWETKTRFSAKLVFSNVDKPDLPKLVTGKAHVFHRGSQKAKVTGGLVGVSFYTKNKFYSCYKNLFETTWHSVYENNSNAAWMAPMMRFGSLDLNGSGGWAQYQYDGSSGGMTELRWYKKHGRKYWEYEVGHLQEGIPAAVYDLCPDFPSAKSLGTFVNTKQTAQKYYDLLAQDRGKRVLRPDLVTEQTARPYDPTLPMIIP